MDNKKLGSIIRNKRCEKSLTQTALAGLIERKPQLICDIEAGRKKPGIDTMILLARELGLSLDTLFLSSNYATGVKGEELEHVGI
ncbi:helix-turn-helix transcriptional regulator [Desulfosporosinus sp. FKA]|uniref:helix-turn-helix transcriptional regulator n=1 Tax=Desulfosporosinus sp. FKA TaxID=1969834 RepID=UPI000B4A32CF|nr:helix-turn-helix transcriptional regulator [Desulfosporosinus sp. FKA]